MKRIILITLLAFGLTQTTVIAQTLEVYSIEGKVEVVKGKSKHTLRLRDKLTNATVLNLAFDAQVELIDVKNKKQYIIKTPGRKSVGEFITDRRNSTLTLTQRYLEYIQAQLRGKGELISRRCSDPATVTREVAADSMYVNEQLNNDFEP